MRHRVGHVNRGRRSYRNNRRVKRSRRGDSHPRDSDLLEDNRMVEPRLEPPPIQEPEILTSSDNGSMLSCEGTVGDLYPEIFSPMEEIFEIPSPMDECSICLQFMDTKTTTPIVHCKECKKMFHHECIVQWRTSWLTFVKYDEKIESPFVPCPLCKEVKGYKLTNWNMARKPPSRCCLL